MNLINSYNENNDLAIYINIPFCKRPCSYCHYKDNLSFGHSCVSDDYFSILYSQLLNICKTYSGKCFQSIYFGGGTPSLLSNKQLGNIQNLFNDYDIKSLEVSMELHPHDLNFDYSSNSFITRYSLAVQTFNINILKKYNRINYDCHDIVKIMKYLKENPFCETINIDLLFQENITQEDLEQVHSLNPSSITLYPNTFGRGVQRLYNVKQSIQKAKNQFSNYESLGKSNFIFLKEDSKPSYYSKIEYETFGHIIGIGHNSISKQGKSSFLTLYENNSIIQSSKVGNRELLDFLSIISIAVSICAIKKNMPNLLQEYNLYTLENDIDINEKYTDLQEDTLVYLPEEEYIRFYKKTLLNYEQIYQESFLRTIGYGDKEISTLEEFYNHNLFLNKEDFKSLALLISNEPSKKLQLPQYRILVEGIDGSGKDTFVKFLAKALKDRFLFDEEKSLSIMGQPDSSLPYGKDAKAFIEDLKYENKEDVIKSLKENNRYCQEKFKNLLGLSIVIRGLLTDIATFQYAFGEDITFTKEDFLFHWDLLIVIDIPPLLAEQRIKERNIPKTWRESIQELTYFREFYLKYNNSMFLQKIFIQNTSLKDLEKVANNLASEIYAKKYHN